MKHFLFTVLLLGSQLSFASIKAFNTAGLDLGHFDDVKCSTGLTCTKSAGKLNIVSSPTLADPLTLTAAEATDAYILMQADESDDNADDWKLTSVASGNAFTISNDTSGSQVAKVSIAAADGDLTLTGGIAGDGGDTLVGLLQSQIASTTTTLTAAQCGSTIVNNSADVLSLPEASTVLGCRYTFIVGNVSNFDVNPDNADQIMLLTDAAGDAIRADAIGESVVLEAISASAWAPVGAEKGTWSDIN